MNEVGAELDCIGLLCPLPVLKSRRALRNLLPGARLIVRTTDPMAAIDIPHLCASDGHVLIEQRHEGTATVFVIERGADRPDLA